MTISDIIEDLNEAAKYHTEEAVDWQESADVEQSAWDALTASEHRSRAASILAAIEQLHRLERLEK